MGIIFNLKCVCVRWWPMSACIHSIKPPGTHFDHIFDHWIKHSAFNQNANSINLLSIVVLVNVHRTYPNTELFNIEQIKYYYGNFELRNRCYRKCYVLLALKFYYRSLIQRIQFLESMHSPQILMEMRN